MADERTWLRHPDTGGYFHAPAEAVDHWTALGFEPTDAPPEVNPAVAEMLAAQRVAAEKRVAADKQDTAPATVADEPTTRKPRAGAGSSSEGVDHGA